MTKNQDYKNAALSALKGHWGAAILPVAIFFVLYLIICVPSYIPGFMEGSNEGLIMAYTLGTIAVSFLFLLNMSVGLCNAFRVLYEKKDYEVLGNTFKFGFKKYLHVLGGMLLMAVVVMLGFLLLVIPGIILAYAYSMTPFLLVEEPDLSVVQVLKKSRTMMKGHKFDYFYLQLSFIGWGLLSILTLFIGLLWLYPYIYTAESVFYVDLREGTIGTEKDPLLKEAVPQE